MTNARELARCAAKLQAAGTHGTFGLPTGIPIRYSMDGGRDCPTTTMRLLLSILIVLAGLGAGLARARRLLRTRDTLTLQTAHRHLPELAVLAPVVVLATLALVILLRIPRVTWFLPPALDLWRELILWTLAGGLFAYLAGIATHVAVVRRDAERNPLLAACTGILLALGYLQVRGTWEIAAQLSRCETPDGYALQTSGYSCAAASLANVARALGVPATERQMARLAGTTCAGTSAGQILHALRQVGLRGTKLTLTLDELRRRPQPCILLVEYADYGPDSHAVAFLPSTNAALRIVDPLVGPQDWSADRLRRVWIGHAIACERP